MRFNLNDYETVESRIRKFYELHEDGRIVTDWENNSRYEVDEKTGPRTWVIRASVYLTAGDQANHLPKATGYAYEIDGTGGANNGSALENAETSAIGRALANMNLSGNKRASREEMEKVERVSQAALDYLAELDNTDTVESIRELYAKAVRGKAAKEVLDKIKAKGESLK
jgi:hypothetical protein